MTATTTTTIRGVSIFSRQRTRKADHFDIALSSEGIAIQRPGQSEQHMTWERIEQWEIQERPGCLVLTLRGGGSVTPLMVKGWTSRTSRPSCGRRPPASPTRRPTDRCHIRGRRVEAVTSEAVASEAVEPEAAPAHRYPAPPDVRRRAPHGAAPGECS